MDKEIDETMKDLLALTSEFQDAEIVNRVRLQKSTFGQEFSTSTTPLPPIGTLVRIRVDCKVSQYHHAEGIKDVQARAGDVGIVESHGAFIKDHYCLARVRMFRLGILVGVSLKSISGERWEVLDG